MSITKVKFKGSFFNDQAICFRQLFGNMIPESDMVGINTWKRNGRTFRVFLNDEEPDENIDFFVIENTLWNSPLPADKKKVIFVVTEPDELVHMANTHNYTYRTLSEPERKDFLYSTERDTKNINFINWSFDTKLVSASEHASKLDKKHGDKIAFIVSPKNFISGHQKRIDFVRYIESQKIDLHLDVYGSANTHNFKTYKGRVPSETPQIFPSNDRHTGNTFDVYKGRKYVIAGENSWQRNYATEKIWEPILCECLVFYWGCPNLEDYIPSSSFVRLPITEKSGEPDFEKACGIIKRTIEAGEYEKRLPSIKYAKKMLLNNYNSYTMISDTMAKNIN